MHKIILATALFLAPTLAHAEQSTWRFSQDPVSGHCIAQTSSGLAKIGFTGLPGGPVSAFVQHPDMPPTDTVTWQVENRPWQQFKGRFDNRNRAVALDHIPSHLLTEVAAGARLGVYIHPMLISGNHPVMGTQSIPLSGSRRALDRLNNCINPNPYGVPTTLVYSSH